MEKVITNNSTDTSNKGKIGKFLFSIIAHILKSVFVITTLMKMNKILDIALKSYVGGIKDKKKYPSESQWFNNQKKRNIIVGLISIFVLFSGILISYNIISNNMFITKGFQKSIEQLKLRKFGEAKRKIQLAQSLDPSFNDDLKLSLQVFGFSLLIAYLWGANALYRNPLIKNSGYLKDSLVESGLTKQEQNPMLLFNPDLGVFMEITNGHSPRSIAENNALWASVGDGIKIGEFSEHPEIRKYVFFKVFYGLKKGDEYGYENYVSSKK